MQPFNKAEPFPLWFFQADYQTDYYTMDVNLRIVNVSVSSIPFEDCLARDIHRTVILAPRLGVSFV